jgi:hypothetical protein
MIACLPMRSLPVTSKLVLELAMHYWEAASLCGALFEFERPVLIENSRNKDRVYLVHRYRHLGPIPTSLVVPSTGDAVPSTGAAVSVAADPSLNDDRRYSSHLKVLDGSLGR